MSVKLFVVVVVVVGGGGGGGGLLFNKVINICIAFPAQIPIRAVQMSIICRNVKLGNSTLVTIYHILHRWHKAAL